MTDFVVKRDANGKRLITDPFARPHLNLAMDRGPDCVCMDHNLAYQKRINISSDYDPSHDGKNVGRGALKACDLWSHQVQLTHF